MSKYNTLWAYIHENGESQLTLTFKELCDYGYAVTKISMKAQTALFAKRQEG